MNDTEILEKLKVAFESRSKEKNAIVVSLEEIVRKAGFAKNSKQRCEELLKKSGEFKLDFKKGNIMVCRKNFKPMEIPMNQNSETKNLSLHDRIKALIDALSQGLYEKEDAVRLALLTAIAGESIFFLGKPGYAKSMIACRLQLAFKSDGDNKAKYFEYLMNQFSTPEDIFGPISLKALNGEGENKEEEYKRIIKNMLPEADIAFLDEIWKASAAIQNTLLTIINERKYSNGNKVINVPLKALFAASNELPAKDRGLEALFDRFILRLIVEPIQDEDNFFDMVDEPSSQEFELPNDVEPISIEEWESWKKKIDEVTISSKARFVISAIRKELAVRNNDMREKGEQDDEMFEVSDRRWKKIVHILKTSAFLNDRTEIDLMDCQLIEYCIWNTEKQQKQVRDIVEKCIKQNGLECDTAIEDINEQIEEFDAHINKNFYKTSFDMPVMHSMNDGETAYKILNPIEISSYKTIKPRYLCKNYEHSGYNRMGAYYDENKEFIGDYDYYFEENTFEQKNNIVSWEDGHSKHKYSLEIEVKKGGLKKDANVFETPDLLELRRNKADTEHYNVIKNHVSLELKKIDDFADSQSAPFKANLFADQHYCDIIMDAIMEAKRELQDAQVDLDKKRSRYQD